MIKTERRDRVALDEAYDFYRQTVNDGSTQDLHKLANSLKTVDSALNAAESGDLELTHRLWSKIRQALFDKLLTAFPAYVVAVTPDGAALANRASLPDGCIIELHPEGLRRDDDVFHMAIEHLHPLTRSRLNKVWIERGPATRKEDFDHMADARAACEDGVCSIRPNTFIIGGDQLAREAQNGRERAYQDYWRLYWQSYCSPSSREKQYLTRQMASLEAVWGNLHY
jgi:hypothetical protein